MSLSASSLVERLVGYFRRTPHPWFGPSEAPLRALGLEYGRVLAHLDLVCRAMRTIMATDRKLFLALADEEADLFFGGLSAASNAPDHGWRFTPRALRPWSRPFAARHELRMGARALPGLFVSTSVKKREGLGDYQRLVTANHDWLADQRGA